MVGGPTHFLIRLFALCDVLFENTGPWDDQTTITFVNEMARAETYLKKFLGRKRFIKDKTIIRRMLKRWDGSALLNRRRQNQHRQGDNMAGFLQKLRTVTLGTAHDLLDKTIDLNSPSALRQYTRDLEDALSKLQNEAAAQAGAVRTLLREQGDLEHQIESAKINTTKFLAAGNKDAARAKAADVVRLQSQLQHINENLATQKELSQKLDASVAQIDAKHSDMVSRVRELERLDRQTKAMEQGARTSELAGKLMSSGVDISTDDIESKMRARNDVAQEKFDRAMGHIDTPEDPETAAAVDDMLAQLTPTTEIKQ